jgi:hypothetical protein
MWELESSEVGLLLHGEETLSDVQTDPRLGGRKVLALLYGRAKAFYVLEDVYSVEETC